MTSNPSPHSNPTSFSAASAPMPNEASKAAHDVSAYAATSNQSELSNSSDATMLNQIVERVQELYSLPAVALEVVKLTGEPTIDCRQLKECVERDPGLTAKILKFVNSPICGHSRKIADLQEALALLGTMPLKLLVLGFSLPSNLVAGVEKEILGFYWRTSLTKAIAAREISRKYWQASGDEPFIAGLLQQVGMLALIQQLGKTYTNFLARVWREKEDLLKLEVASMGFDHTVLSSRLLDSWFLPPHLIRAVGASPNSNRVAKHPNEADDLVHILHLANLVARLFAHDEETALPSFLENGERYRGEPLDDVDSLLAAIEDQVNQLAELLDLELSDSEQYNEILNRARARMTDMAAESLQNNSNHSIEDTDPSGGDPALRAKLLDQSKSAAQIENTIKPTADHFSPGAANQSPNVGSNLPSENRLTNSMADDGYALYDPDGNGQREHLETGISGVGDPTLSGKMMNAVARCRQQRCGLSIAVIEIDGFQGQFAQLSTEQIYHISQTVCRAIRALFETEHEFIVVSDSRFAIIFEDEDPKDAISQLRQLIDGIKRWGGAPSSERKSSVSLSVGLASMGVPPRNFDPQELIERAERCLSTAQHFGGDTLKSIVL